MTIKVEGSPYGVMTASDGSVWFTMAKEGRVGRVVDGAVELFELDPAGQPTVIVEGPGGVVWVAEYLGGRVSAIGGPSVPLASPYGLAVGADGALWVTQLQQDTVARVDAAGEVTSVAVPGMPSAVAAGPDGNLWVTLNQGNGIARVTTAGEVTVFPLPTEGAMPVGITAGPDGALWFVEIGAGQVGRISVAGEVTEFPLPDRGARPHAIIAGPDGALWFTEWSAGRLGRITTGGEISEFELEGEEPHGLAVGPDGRIWVAMESGTLVRSEGGEGPA
ncbi:MAG: virginiamycin B lyase [Nonomuraea sp.]|nr:virginiamycin B lyase [Nonomuraea sp.]